MVSCFVHQVRLTESISARSQSRNANDNTVINIMKLVTLFYYSRASPTLPPHENKNETQKTIELKKGPRLRVKCMIHNNTFTNYKRKCNEIRSLARQALK